MTAFRHFSLFAALLITSCANAGISEAPDAVMLRVANASASEFASVQVQYPNGEVRFGPVPAGGASEYQEADGVYRYGSILVTARGETYDLRAIDYTGETPLTPGRYTYRLSLDGAELTQELVRD